MPAGFTRVIAVATLTAVLTLPLAAAQLKLALEYDKD